MIRQNSTAVALAVAFLCAVTFGTASTLAASVTTISAQDAAITAAGNIIVAHQVPVQIGTGAPTFFDVTIDLSAILSGAKVTGVTATATSLPSQSVITAGFQAGTYTDSYGNTYYVGGGVAGKGGNTEWSLELIALNGKQNCALNGATWYTNDDSSNPEYPILQKYKITTTAYGFGTASDDSSGGSGCTNGIQYAYQPGYLIGAAQSGNLLTITSFQSYTSGGISQTPVASWQFRWKSP